MTKGQHKEPHNGSRVKILVDLILNKGWQPTYKEAIEHFYDDYTKKSYDDTSALIQQARKWLRRKGMELYCDKDTRKLKILDTADELLYQVELNEKHTIATIKNVYRQQDNLERDFSGDDYAIAQAEASALRILQEVHNARLLKLNQSINDDPRGRNQ